MAATADLIILEEVLDKLHPLVEHGKLVQPYKKQLRKFQRNLIIAVAYLRGIANSEKRVDDVFKEIKKELMYIVLVAEHQLIDYQHCPQSSTTGPSSPGDGVVHVRCMNGGTLWVSVHQHLMARRLCKLNQQLEKLKNQLVDIGEDILEEKLISDSRQEMSGFLQEIALAMIVCYVLAYALSNLLIDQSLALSMQAMQLRSRIQQQIGQIIAKIDQLSRIQQRIERLMITMQQRPISEF